MFADEGKSELPQNWMVLNIGCTFSTVRPDKKYGQVKYEQNLKRCLGIKAKQNAMYNT